MAEETVVKDELSQTNPDQVMELDTTTTTSESNVNRQREDDGGEKEGPIIKKPKLELRLGPKSFGSSLEMFDYLFKFLHYWPKNLNFNKFEHMVFLDLIKKGREDPEKKMGSGIEAFQVGYHPTLKSKCFFIVRKDESTDSFSFRKYVDYILPLPEEMKVKHDNNSNGSLGGNFGREGARGGRRGHGRGRGRNFK